MAFQASREIRMAGFPGDIAGCSRGMTGQAGLIGCDVGMSGGMALDRRAVHPKVMTIRAG